MVEPVIKNPGFTDPGDNPGEADEWGVFYVATDVWANLGKGGSLQPQDNVSWFDKFARLIGCKDGPFPLIYHEFEVDNIVPGESRLTIHGINIQGLLPPGAYVLVETLTGNDTVGGFWQVDQVLMEGTSSSIYLDGDMLWTAPSTVKVVIPPILYCDVDGYGWKAKLSDLTTYPIKFGGVPAGAKALVTVDRGAVQEIPFSGGESSMLNVTAKFDEHMVGAKVIIENGSPVYESDTRGSGSHIHIDPNDTTMNFEAFEATGRGQFVQLWGDLFENMAEARSDELAEVFSSYLQHCRVSGRYSSDGGWVDVKSEHQGVGSKLKIYGPRGSLTSGADWPISARVPGDNELDVTLNGVDSFTITLDEGATTPEEIVDTIQTKIGEYDPTASAFIAGGQLYMSVYGSIEVTGGSANTDLVFEEDVVCYGDTVAMDLGFSDEEVLGEDGELYEDFDALESILALFGGDGVGDQFDWYAHFLTLAEAGELPGEIKNWLVELSEGDIDQVDQSQNRISIEGTADKTFAYRPKSKAIIVNSPGNDREYTVDYSEYVGDVTWIYFVEQLPDGTDGEGTIRPKTWFVDGDTFEDGWGGGIEEGWISPRVADGRVFGEPISFPLRIQDNRNVLWVCPFLQVMKSVQVTGGEYETPDDLVSELNDQLAVSGVGEAFSFEYLELSDGTYRLTFGKNIERGLPERYSCAFFTVSGRQRGKDVRSTIGFSNLSPNGAERFIVYPRSLFDSINGTPDQGELTDEDSFLADPYSLVIWERLSDPDLLMTHVLDNDEEAGLFNDLEPSVVNSYVEYFVVDGWGGPKIDVTLSPDVPEAGPVFSDYAQFQGDVGDVDYEQFHIARWS